MTRQQLAELAADLQRFLLTEGLTPNEIYDILDAKRIVQQHQAASEFKKYVTKSQQRK